MQTKILLSFVILIMSFTASAQQSFYSTAVNKGGLPNREPSFDLTVIPGKEGTSFVLYINNPEQKKIRLQISHLVYDFVEDTLFTSEKYSRRYNLEQAVDGNYILTLICGKDKISRKIEVNTVTTRQMVVD